MKNNKTAMPIKTFVSLLLLVMATCITFSIVILVLDNCFYSREKSAPKVVLYELKDKTDTPKLIKLIEAKPGDILLVYICDNTWSVRILENRLEEGLIKLNYAEKNNPYPPFCGDGRFITYRRMLEIML